MNPFDLTEDELHALELAELEQAEWRELRELGYDPDEVPVTRRRLGTGGSRQYAGSRQARRPRPRRVAAPLQPQPQAIPSQPQPQAPPADEIFSGGLYRSIWRSQAGQILTRRQLSPRPHLRREGIPAGDWQGGLAAQ